MSSSDRNSRRRPTPPPAPPDHADEVYYEDDVFYGGDWREADVVEEDIVDYEAPAPTRQRPASGQQGTAAQINRLQQSLGRQPARSDTERLPSPRSRPSRAEESAPPRAAARSRQQQPPPVRRESPPADYVDYDDLDADAYDPYTEYEDDFSEYDAPPRNQRAARPRPSVPAFKRPSLPPAIANADLVNDAPALAMIGTGIVGLVAMAILVGNQAPSLAPEFATHVSASGILEHFRSESAFWRLPIMATAFTLMNMVIAWFTAPIDRFASRFAIAAALLVQAVIWVAVIRIL